MAKICSKHMITVFPSGYCTRCMRVLPEATEEEYDILRERDGGRAQESRPTTSTGTYTHNNSILKFKGRDKGIDKE